MFNEWRRRKQSKDAGNNFEYYEDTFSDSIDYINTQAKQNMQNTQSAWQNTQPTQNTQNTQSAWQNTQATQNTQNTQSAWQNTQPTQNTQNTQSAWQNGQNVVRMPNTGDRVVPRNYQNVVVYQPSSPEDVQTLIDFLKRKEPAVVDLNGGSPDTSQRILDFISGAIYALNGTVHRIAGNIFLISPEGVEITVPIHSQLK